MAVYEIGCAFGALSVIFGGDILGRRTTVIYGQIILIVGAVSVQVSSFIERYILIDLSLQFSSYSLAQLIVGRIVSKLRYTPARVFSS